MHRPILILFACFAYHCVSAQALTPGFDTFEYSNAMLISVRATGEDSYMEKYEMPVGYTLHYRSPELGLQNLYEIWTGSEGRAVLSIRGTTEESVSWLENFYAAMVPAKGTLQLSEGRSFAYQLAPQADAAVHVGWLVGMAFIAEDAMPRIRQMAEEGFNNWLMVGHSQGGAIAYLLTAHWKELHRVGKLPANLQLKTYCSAAPKPGNLPFAYHYEHITRGEWAFNVVNAADWVPEVPISIQTLDDFTALNPFADAKAMIHKQKFPQNIALRGVYNKLDKPTRQAQKNYQKYLGEMTSKAVKKNLDGFEAPAYVNTNHYVRTGAFVVLMPDEAYHNLYPGDEGIFSHHQHAPYLYLCTKLAKPGE